MKRSTELRAIEELECILDENSMEFKKDNSQMILEVYNNIPKFHLFPTTKTKFKKERINQTSLPDDLLKIIFSYLAPLEFVIISSCCQEFYELIYSPPALNKKTGVAKIISQFKRVLEDVKSKISPIVKKENISFGINCIGHREYTEIFLARTSGFQKTEVVFKFKDYLNSNYFF
jgi:hypothetical protein